MKPYEGLATVYDYLMSGVDYEQWADYMEEIFNYFSIEPRDKILDVACGTGGSTLPWSRRGYRAFGIDISAGMLSAAAKKAEEQGLNISFLNQDMRKLELPFKVDVALLYQDGLNYLVDEAEIEEAFNSISSALRPGGYFIFNLNLVDKLPASTEPQVYWVDEDDLTLIWESFLQRENKIWRIKLAAFIYRGDGLYYKVEEEHRERSYSQTEIERLLQGSSFKIAACYSAFTFMEPAPEDRNIVYVLQREE